MKTYYIYMLCENNTPYYVGCTVQGKKRWPKEKHNHFEVLESTTDNKTASFLELHWIDVMRSWGFKLKNTTKYLSAYPIANSNGIKTSDIIRSMKPGHSLDIGSKSQTSMLILAKLAAKGAEFKTRKHDGKVYLTRTA